MLAQQAVGWPLCLNPGWPFPRGAWPIPTSSWAWDKGWHAVSLWGVPAQESLSSVGPFLRSQIFFPYLSICCANRSHVRSFIQQILTDHLVCVRCQLSQWEPRVSCLMLSVLYLRVRENVMLCKCIWKRTAVISAINKSSCLIMAYTFLETGLNTLYKFNPSLT